MYFNIRSLKIILHSLHQPGTLVTTYDIYSSKSK